MVHSSEQYLVRQRKPNKTVSVLILYLPPVLLLRAGYILVQIGSIPTENVYVILLHNLVDIAVSVASFGLIGFTLAYGHDTFSGLVGYKLWIVSDSIDLDEALFGKHLI